MNGNPINEARQLKSMSRKGYRDLTIRVPRRDPTS